MLVTKKAKIVFKLQFSETATGALTVKEQLFANDRENSVSGTFNSPQARFHSAVLS